MIQILKYYKKIFNFTLNFNSPEGASETLDSGLDLTKEEQDLLQMASPFIVDGMATALDATLVMDDSTDFNINNTENNLDNFDKNNIDNILNKNLDNLSYGDISTLIENWDVKDNNGNDYITSNSLNNLKSQIISKLNQKGYNISGKIRLTPNKIDNTFIISGENIQDFILSKYGKISEKNLDSSSFDNGMGYNNDIHNRSTVDINSKPFGYREVRSEKLDNFNDLLNQMKTKVDYNTLRDIYDTVVIQQKRDLKINSNGSVTVNNQPLIYSNGQINRKVLNTYKNSSYF